VCRASSRSNQTQDRSLVDELIRRLETFLRKSAGRESFVPQLSSLRLDRSASASFKSRVGFVVLVLDLLDQITTMAEDRSAEAEVAAAKGLNSNDDEKLRDFYAQHDVSVDHVFPKRLGNNGETTAELTPKSCHPHRFIRLNPRYDMQETLELIKVC
jgi:hypothetical protein